MKNFTYDIPTRVFFGTDSLDNLGKETGKYSTRVLIVYGSERVRSSGLLDKVTNELKYNNISFKEISGIKPNPTLESVRRGVGVIKENNLGFVLAVGGGSVIDAAKGMAAGAANNIDPWQFCINKEEVKNCLPIASILTLSATGSEMNGNSVLSNTETGEKLYFGSQLCRPVFSILNPTLTYSVPKDQTAYGVADIFTHVTEQYFEPEEGAGISDRLSEGILRACIQYGRKAIDNPRDYEARANLMWASSLALNNLISRGKSGGDWATHMIEHELSAAYDISHGLGLAILLPNWMKNVLNGDTVNKLAVFAENVWGIEMGDKLRQAETGIKATRDFFSSLDIPSQLSEVNIDDSQIRYMAEQSVRFGEIGSFKKLKADDVEQILRMSL